MLTVVQDKAEGIQQQNKESDKEHSKAKASYQTCVQKKR
jgi:hypothetical protein